MSPVKLNPAAGLVIPGTIVDDQTFLATVQTGLLFHVTADPRLTEDRKARETSPELQRLYEVRQDVQRIFAGAKAANVAPYSEYLIEVQLEGGDGAIPTIILWTPTALKVAALEGEEPLGHIQVPYTLKMVAIDGETQLAARYEANRERPGEFDKTPVTIKICHGRPVGWACQAFHDLNVLGVQVNAAVAIAMDNRDAYTKLARDLEQDVPLFRGKVNKAKRQLGSKDRDLVTITALRGACVTLGEGIAGVKYGTGPVEINSNRLPHVKQVATEWFTAVSQAFGADIEDRQGRLASAPAILAAIGAMGHDLLAYDQADVGGRHAKRDELLARLRQVKWEKGELWEGIAGKRTPKGAFSIGGTKETVYAVYRALNEPTSPEGRQVRGEGRMQPGIFATVQPA